MHLVAIETVRRLNSLKMNIHSITNKMTIYKRWSIRLRVRIHLKRSMIMCHTKHFVFVDVFTFHNRLYCFSSQIDYKYNLTRTFPWSSYNIQS